MNLTSGICTNIQRFSLHDGPGIRTTVFLKGCPLRCIWCHNPETWKRGRELFFSEAKCVGCGICVKECANGAVSVADGKAKTDRKLCTSCLACANVCPARARTASGEEYTADELAEILKKDSKYYEKSGGGVTFSGGEPLLQTDFVCAVADLMRKSGIHTAMETSLYASSENVERAAEHIDFFMVDIKSTDDAAHKKFTGVSVLPILENVKLLSSLGKKVLIRIPIVETFNATAQNIRATAKFLSENTDFREVELLRMHKLAEGKYSSLDRAYEAAELPIPTEEKMISFAELLAELGIKAHYKKDTYEKGRG